MLRNADPGVVLPGIDTPVGNQLAPSSLKGLSSIPTSSSAPIWYRADVNEVIVKQAGAVVDGYNFGTATVVVAANNVTIQNCTFSATANWAIQEYGYTGLTVKNSTFYGGSIYTPGTSVNTIAGNAFIHSVGDAIDAPGTITGNYFEGGGYSTVHSDAIWETNSSVPTVIANNLIDWTSSGPYGSANNAVRITTEKGSVSNVTVRNNFLLGGTYAIDAGNGGGSSYTYSNINIDNNYIGFSLYGPFYPGAQQGVAKSGNVVFDFTNRAYSDQAWSAYKAAGLPTDHLVVDGGSAGWVNGLASGSSTVYGSGIAGVHIGGSANETNFVGGFGGQFIGGGSGKNIFTYLAISDSGAGGVDTISSFHPAQDVIDLSHIDADLTTAGVQSFTFIGTAAFSAAGGQLSYWDDTAHNTTWVYADLVGDSSADLTIKLVGNLTLTAANFALTPAQSAAAFGTSALGSAGTAMTAPLSSSASLAAPSTGAGAPGAVSSAQELAPMLSPPLTSAS